MGGSSGCTNESIIYTLLIVALIVNAECRSLPSINEDLRDASEDRIEGHRAEISAELRVEESGASKTLAFEDDNSMLLVNRLRRAADANTPKAVKLSRGPISSEDLEELEKTTPNGKLCSLVGMKAGVQIPCAKRLLVEWSPAESNNLANITIYASIDEIKRQVYL